MMPRSVAAKRALLAVSVAVTAVFVVWFVRNQNWSEIGATFRHAKVLYVFLSLVPMALLYLLRVLRWKILMRPVKQLSFFQLLGATLVGFTANNILPLRAGELVRPAIVKIRHRGSFTATLATIAVERLLDLVGLGVMLAFVCIFWPLPSSARAEGAFNATKAALFLTAVIGAAAAFVALLRLRPEAVRGLVRWQPRLLSLFDSFVTGLAFVEDLHHLALTLIYSILIWGMAAASMHYSALAFGLHMTYAGSGFVLLCVALAVALPQGPGFVGTFHFVAQWAAELLGNAHAAAAGFAILAHASAVIPVTLSGFIALWLMGLSLGDVRRQAQQNEASEKAAP